MKRITDFFAKLALVFFMIQLMQLFALREQQYTTLWSGWIFGIILYAREVMEIYKKFNQQKAQRFYYILALLCVLIIWMGCTMTIMANHYGT